MEKAAIPSALPGTRLPSDIKFPFKDIILYDKELCISKILFGSFDKLLLIIDVFEACDIVCKEPEKAYAEKIPEICKNLLLSTPQNNY